MHISCTNGPCMASWRTKVSLPPGVYLLEGDARAAGILTDTNKTRLGAGLRISGKPREEKLQGDVPWKHLNYTFTNQFDDVEIVCELKGLQGEVWFDKDSLRLVRREQN